MNFLPVLAFCLMSVIMNVEAQIGAKTQQHKIYGTWVNNNFGYQMTLMLNADGSGQFDGDVIKFSVQTNKLLIKQEGVVTSYTFSLQENSLTVSGGDLDQAVTFTRNATNADARKTDVKSKSVASSDDLNGSWTNYGETIIFNNGQCTYLGQNCHYYVSGNQITLQTSQGNILMTYTVTGSQLTLTVNGQQLTYNKGGTLGTTAKTQTINNGKPDMTLVGKWCYVNVSTSGTGGSSTDECITLNGDGTYEYYSERSRSTNTAEFSAGTASQDSDYGTWWVGPGRIYYNSSTRGQGSYVLVKQNHPKNGDPMIVLDGTSYVTFFQKSPW